jgi:hypothetical protein
MKIHICNLKRPAICRLQLDVVPPPTHVGHKTDDIDFICAVNIRREDIGIIGSGISSGDAKECCYREEHNVLVNVVEHTCQKCRFRQVSEYNYKRCEKCINCNLWEPK